MLSLTKMDRHYNSKPTPKLKNRIIKAASCSFYILHESGPLAFTLAKRDAGMEESDRERATFTVRLGTTHSCSCRKHSREGNLCIHVLWSLVKIFRVDVNSELLFQYELTDREIESLILKGRRQGDSSESRVAHDEADNNGSSVVEAEEGVPARPVAEDDVCPICQDTLLGSEAASKLIHCKKSCGNSMHVKCLKVLINHQKSLQLDDLKCPLCRKLFGSIDQVLADIDSASKKAATTTSKLHSHYGMECSNCDMYPIKGNLYRCKTCLSGLYLCEKCFASGSHSQHAFEKKPKPHSKWEPGVRAVEPTLPVSIIRSLEHRELTQEDYDMLLTLDSGPQQQGSIPMHIINSFPLFKINNETDKKRIRLDEEGICKVCAVKIRHGEVARQIPCGHGFHRECIDRWLLNSRSTCPCCGQAAFTAIEGDEQNCIAAIPQYTLKKKRQKNKTLDAGKKGGSKGSEIPIRFDSFLMIRGSEAISGGSANGSSSSTPPSVPSFSFRNTSQGRRLVLPPISTHRRQLPHPIAAPSAESLILQSNSVQASATASSSRSLGTGKSTPSSSLAGRKTFGIPHSLTVSANRTPAASTPPDFSLSISTLRLG